jgi:hypothetical protein
MLYRRCGTRWRKVPIQRKLHNTHLLYAILSGIQSVQPPFAFFPSARLPICCHTAACSNATNQCTCATGPDFSDFLTGDEVTRYSVEAPSWKVGHACWLNSCRTSHLRPHRHASTCSSASHSITTPHHCMSALPSFYVSRNPTMQPPIPCCCIPTPTPHPPPPAITTLLTQIPAPLR